MARPRTVIPVLIPAVAAGGVWWWAVLRLVLAPEHTGAVEKVVAAGGWGLSLLPVHVASRAALAAEAAERAARRRRRGVPETGGQGPRDQAAGSPWER
jgi:hypothetical protein